MGRGPVTAREQALPARWLCGGGRVPADGWVHQAPLRLLFVRGLTLLEPGAGRVMYPSPLALERTRRVRLTPPWRGVRHRQVSSG